MVTKDKQEDYSALQRVSSEGLDHTRFQPGWTPWIPPASAAWSINLCLIETMFSSLDTTDFSRVEIQPLPLITSTKAEAGTSTRLKSVVSGKTLSTCVFRQKLKYRAAEAGGIRVSTQNS
jgi:hypothetical protein